MCCIGLLPWKQKMKTFSEALGIPGVSVARAAEIADGLVFSGPAPKVSRGDLLRLHWEPDGSRGMTFDAIAVKTGVHRTGLTHEHAKTLRRLRSVLVTPDNTDGGAG